MWFKVPFLVTSLQQWSPFKMGSTLRERLCSKREEIQFFTNSSPLRREANVNLAITCSEVYPFTLKIQWTLNQIKIEDWWEAMDENDWSGSAVLQHAIWLAFLWQSANKFGSIWMSVCNHWTGSRNYFHFLLYCLGVHPRTFYWYHIDN